MKTDDMKIRRMTHDELEIASAICLTMGSPIRLSPHGNELEIEVVDGKVWITEENDPADYILAPGEHIWQQGRAVIVIETLTPFACIKVMDGGSGSWPAGAGAAASETKISMEA